MASFQRLPECFERVVLVGGVSSYGVILGASLALSPFLHSHQEVILTNAICTQGGNRTAAVAESVHDAQLAREALETLAAVKRDVLRSRTEVCNDGVAPSLASPEVLPMQHFIGNQYPATGKEVSALLSKVKLHIVGLPAPLGGSSGGAPAEEGSVVSPTSSTDSGSGGPLVVRRGKDILMCVLNADVQAALKHTMRHESIVAQIQRVLAARGTAANAESRSDAHLFTGGCVIAITDDRSRHILSSLVQATSPVGGVHHPCLLTVARARELTPPALEYALTKVAVADECVTNTAHGAGAFTGMLTALSAGVLLGVLTEVPVYRHDKTPFVPVDVAINTALCHAIEQMRRLMSPAANVKELHSLPAQTSLPAAAGGGADGRAWQSVVAVEPKVPTDTMVWGMFGEYLSDYYGRYAQPIWDAFPMKELLPKNATALNFLFSPSDSINYGVDTVDATRCLERSAARAHREKLASSLPAGWGFVPFLSNLETTVSRTGEHSRMGTSSSLPFASARAAVDATGLPASLRDKIPGLSSPTSMPTPSATASAVSAQLAGPIASRQGSCCDGGAYQQLLISLSTSAHTVPLLQYTALGEVDWNRYVCFVAKVVLDAVAARAAAGPQPAKPCTFPFPTRIFTNDLIFVEALAAPRQQSRIRRTMGMADWVCRCGLNANGVRGEMVPGFTPARMAALLSQPSVVQVIEATAAASATPTPGSSKDAKAGNRKEEVVKRAKRILTRIGDTQNHVQCRTIGVMVYYLFKKVYNRVYFNPGAYEHLRRINALPRNAIVYVPLHRSYSDFLIMSYLLISMGLRPPHIVAGEDFLRLGKFSELMRGSGAFFMRRSFRGDPLYGALFKEYVAQMVRSCMPLEFFIEGTRSRTGKTLVPKMGILKFITDAFLAQQHGQGSGEDTIEDVLFVPVSLSYDELLEAKVYADELLGIPKPKESVPNMIRAATQLTHKYGNINMHFGEPISLKAVRENPFECPVPFQPKETEVKRVTPRPANTTANKASAAVGFPKPSTTPAHLLTSLAWRIAYELQQNVCITATALVAAAVETLMPRWELDALKRIAISSRDKASGSTAVQSPAGLPRAHVVAMTAWIGQAVQLRGGNLLPSLTTAQAARGGNASVDWDAIVTSALRNLNRFVKPDRKKADSLAAPAEAAVVFDPPTVTSRLGVNISTNQLIHVFLDEAVVAVAAHAFGEVVVDASSSSSSPKGPHGGKAVGRIIGMSTLTQTTQFLRSLLSAEFPNFASFSPCSYDSWLQYAISRLTLGEEERQAVQRCRQLRASNIHKGHVTGSSVPGGRYSPEPVIVPETRLFDFLLQLLLPHVEALYMVAVTALACFEASALDAQSPSAENAHQPVFVKYLTIAAHKAAQRLFEQRLLEYIVACNKETMTHYFQSLVDMKLLKTHTVMDLGLAYIPGEAASGGKVPSDNQQVQQKGRGRLQKPQLAGLEKLVTDLQALRWHPSTDPQEDLGITKRTVLTCYHAVSRGAKL